MRLLKFNRPYPVTQTKITKEYLNEPDGNYERHLSVATKHGVVMVSELKWNHNRGQDNFTIFSTVLNGYYYSATLKEAKLSDRCVKWMSTNFIKRIIKPIS